MFDGIRDGKVTIEYFSLAHHVWKFPGWTSDAGYSHSDFFHGIPESLETKLG
jgi:hypothetical protein